VTLALEIAFFEAVFWRGSVLLRLVESFGVVLYAANHVGYAMEASEMVFLFFIGIIFAAVFLIITVVGTDIDPCIAMDAPTIAQVIGVMFCTYR